ncbi:PhzF family phenazine biosynthesis protein [Nocardiopsis baichengensis]|uniref:PhzF family phenazine biosynthesis protein n=1 Tax=Nocardiopsis baichengensis TaxID=280240 RepID=UPI000371A855|nr:PhzF family phenazine biosynthesis protein [Nocardiopsis baichengensis]
MTRFRVVDAFTDQPFSGNPAAVIAVDGPLDEGWAQRAAAEFNLSETAFLTPHGGPGADFGLRWFTPSVEVALCGHATLAAAHALFQDGAQGPLRFSTRWSGVLTVERRDGRLWMDFPANPPQEAPAPHGLADALGARIERAGTAGTGDLMVELADERTVRGLDPVPARMSGHAERGVIATARADEGRPYAFVSRFFATDVGVEEDPVTGSAHTVLAPYWAERLGGTAFSALQCSARGGRVEVELPAGAPGRVLIGGSAVTVSEGHLLA